MAILEPDRSVVVVIDMQGRLMDMVHRPGLVVTATRRLLELAELFRVPVLLTEQYPKGLGQTHPEILESFDALSTEKRKVEKESFGCCAEPRFLEALAGLRAGLPLGRLQLVLAGIEAHICVLQTTLELLAMGAEVQLCWECVSGRGAEYRQRALERMQQAGAGITNHESVGFEWARDKNHPQFRAMSQLFRGVQPG